MLRKVISGGQTGADQGGLYAAKLCGLETGGAIPKGFLTENGAMPELKELFNLEEHSSAHYPPRTLLNVAESDGTVRIAVNFSTAGEKCTLRACKDLQKPYFDIKVVSEDVSIFFREDNIEKTKVMQKYKDVINECTKWIQENNIKILNVAGNRESTSPGLCQFVSSFLTQVFLFEKQ